ncbi:MAG TPA: TIGR04255 family protein [Acidobacteriaceae bacterium]|nr:TIGR04255 family protein [Acidobacteriaceae bacterium]
MAKPRLHLANAPIVEALIDFRVLPQAQIAVDELGSMNAEVGMEYSKREQINVFSTRLDFNEGRSPQAVAAHSKVGWLYKSQTQVAQFRLDGFTFSRLVPYTTWEGVFEEAMRLWKIYVQKAQPVQISRMAVRYINRMKLQGPATLNSYLTAPPELPEPSPQSIRDFLCRILVTDSKRSASAAVIQALEPQFEPSSISLLLDIDAYLDRLTLDPSDPSIPEKFESLRQLKNEIFFACITERTAEIYQ